MVSRRFVLVGCAQDERNIRCSCIPQGTGLMLFIATKMDTKSKLENSQAASRSPWVLKANFPLLTRRSRFTDAGSLSYQCHWDRRGSLKSLRVTQGFSSSIPFKTAGLRGSRGGAGLGTLRFASSHRWNLLVPRGAAAFEGMSYRCDLEEKTSLESLRRAVLVHVPNIDLTDEQSTFQPPNSKSTSAARRDSSVLSCLEKFLHHSPVRCLEAVARFLDLPSFVVLLSLNTSLLRLCDSPALLPCWTHFALVQRILRHGENVLVPLRSPISIPVQRGTGGGSWGRGGGKSSGQHARHDDWSDQLSPCQTFSRLLPRVTRLDLVRIGSLNSNWRTKSFSTEQRQVICSQEALDKAYVLPAPPFVSSLNEFCVAADAQLNLQACPSLGQPACLQRAQGAFTDVSPIFTLLPSMHIFATHAAPSTSRGQSVEVKLPLLPAKISSEPDPLIKFGGYAPKGWLLGEDEVSLQAAIGGALGGSRPTARISQSQRKRQQRQQRQQQPHRLHMSWVHVAPHPLRPCSQDGSKGEPLKCSSRDGSPLLSFAPPPSKPFNELHPLLGGDNSPVYNADPLEGLGYSPVVRLLCLCLPPIEVEASAPLETPVAGDRGSTGDEDRGEAAFEPRQKEAGAASPAAAESLGCGNLTSHPVSLEAPAVETSACSLGLSAPAASHEETGGTAEASAAPLLPSCVALERPAAPLHPRRIWPIALCSYSSKGARILAHAIVCCALREGEAVKSARSRLWYKAKSQKKTVRGSTSKNLSCRGDEEAQAMIASALASEARVLQSQSEPPSTSNNGIKALSFSMQKHPSAVLVGIVAVGTSQGRILCTPPPLCLVRRCYCGENCASYNAGATDDAGSSSLGGSDAQPIRGTSGGSLACSLGAESSGRPSSLQQKPGGFASPSRGSSSSHSLGQTAAKAGCGVAFTEVGDFGGRGGAVDYVELVRGTPWASHAQRQEQPQLLIPTQQRDFSWHWSRAPTAAVEKQGCAGVSVNCDSASNVLCGGVEAEALWLFACSKQSGLKIFRFMWSLKPLGRRRDAQTKSSGLEAAYGEWKCVFTLRGSCQLVSLDLNSGVIALCTPTDSRVYFLCFRHLLPPHVYMPNTALSSVVHAEDLANFGRCGLPRPQQVPVGGYLPVLQQQFTALLQSPAECARIEVLVARRPSFLQPLGGCRWVVIDGAVIRVVQVLVRDTAPQRKPLDAAWRDLFYSTLTGSPLEQLRQLRRPVWEEPKRSWTLDLCPAPELQATRLCVFSHPRTIYHCAFDGMRRLVTVDLQETLMIWDLQRYTKLCGVDLMARGDKRRRDYSSSEDVEGCSGDGEDIGASSDGLGSEHEAFRSTLSKRGNRVGGRTEGTKLSSARAARKLARHNLKKQFGTEWMQKHVLAHRNSTHHPYNMAPSTRASGAGGLSMMPSPEERVAVGGMWFTSNSLEPAMQLQRFYDLQRGAANNRGPVALAADAGQHARSKCGDNGNELGNVTKLQLAGETNDNNDGSDNNIKEVLVCQCEPARANDSYSGAQDTVKVEAADSEPLPAINASYADDFPPLGAHSQTRGGRNRCHSVPKQSCPTTIPRSGVVVSRTAPAAGPSDMLRVSDIQQEQRSIMHPFEPSRRTWGLSNSASKAEQHVQQVLESSATDSTAGAGVERPSFAAVVATGGSSAAERCPRTGWSTGVTEHSALSDMLGEEEARALQETAAALGMSIEELYLQQVVQWQQLQGRGPQRTGTEETMLKQEEPASKTAVAPTPMDQSVVMTAAGAELGEKPDTASVQVGGGSQAGEKAGGQVRSADVTDEATPSSDTDSAKASPAAPAFLDRPRASPVQGSGALRGSPLFGHAHPFVESFEGRSENRMVGLLGRQRCVARLGPNAQRRHVTALCLSETCIAVLFKNLKTWQIWTFASSAGLASDADGAL
ncbi:hypothetical protein ACSSS7_001934 [Eimeria intestinalis]